MKISTRNMVLVAMFAALMCIGAYVQIPFYPVPITLQIVFCLFSGIILGSKLGALSQIVYVTIGLIGMPVFASGSGGPTYVLKPTFGYLIGYIVGAYVVGKIIENSKEINFKRLFIATFSGLMAVYILGVPYLYIIMNKVLGTPMTVGQSIWVGFVVSIVPDIIKSIIISILSLSIVPILKKNGYIKSKITG